jgi:hypothetical protein
MVNFVLKQQHFKNEGVRAQGTVFRASSPCTLSLSSPGHSAHSWFLVVSGLSHQPEKLVMQGLPVTDSPGCGFSEAVFTCSGLCRTLSLE